MLRAALERSLGFYRDVLGLEPLGLEEFNRCSRSLGNPHVEELQTIAHEGDIFLTAVRLGAYSEVGYLEFPLSAFGFLSPANYPNPASRARMIASARSATCSLWSMFETWLRTVLGLR